MLWLLRLGQQKTNSGLNGPELARFYGPAREMSTPGGAPNAGISTPPSESEAPA